MTEKYQYASTVAEINEDPAALNLRNDMCSVVELPNGTLFAAYTRFPSVLDPNVGGKCTIYGVVSTDGAETWGEPFEIVKVVGNDLNYVPSLYLQDNGNIVLLYHQKASTYVIKKAISTDGGLTFTGNTTIHTFTKKSSPGPDRILKMPSGRLWFATSQRTNDEDSSATATNNGRLFYSDDDGDTWINSNLDIQAADQSCQEPGIFQKNGLMYYYWRSDRTFYQKYVTIPDVTSSISHSVEKDLGYWNPSSTHTIKYDEKNDVFWAVKHRVFREVSTSTRQNRPYLELYASRRDVGQWQRVATVDYEADRFFFEPSILFLGDTLLITYSRYIPHAGSYKYDLLSRRIYIPSVLPTTDDAEYRHLDIVYKQQWNQILGGNGDMGIPEWLSMTFDKFPRWLAFWRWRNDGNSKYGSFTPVEEIRTYLSTRNVTRRLDMSVCQTAFPFQLWEYSLAGVGTGINAAQPIEKRQLKGGTILHEIYANGKHKFPERIEFAGKTSAEIAAFTGVVDGQITYNSETKQFLFRENGQWVTK